MDTWWTASGSMPAVCQLGLGADSGQPSSVPRMLTKVTISPG